MRNASEIKADDYESDEYNYSSIWSRKNVARHAEVGGETAFTDVNKSCGIVRDDFLLDGSSSCAGGCQVSRKLYLRWKLVFEPIK